MNKKNMTGNVFSQQSSTNRGVSSHCELGRMDSPRHHSGACGTWKWWKMNSLVKEIWNKQAIISKNWKVLKSNNEQFSLESDERWIVCIYETIICKWSGTTQDPMVSIVLGRCPYISGHDFPFSDTCIISSRTARYLLPHQLGIKQAISTDFAACRAFDRGSNSFLAPGNILYHVVSSGNIT